MKQNKGKDKNSVFLVIGILLVVAIITVGYAALQTTLQINGDASIGGATWDIHFENIEATNESTVTPTVAPTASGTDTTTLEYEVSLPKPGDVYQFTADIVNDGSLDAKLRSVTKGGNNLNYVIYDISYVNGTQISEDDILEAGHDVTVLVTIQYDKDLVDEDDITGAAVPLELSATFNYVQR